MVRKGTGRVTAVAWMALLGACGFGAAGLAAQQQPAQHQQTQQPRPSEANPFPEDTSNVPVVPSNGVPPEVANTSDKFAPAPASVMADSDPVRSPDDGLGAGSASGSSSEDSWSSSSSAGLDRMEPQPDADTDNSGNSGHRTLRGNKPAPPEHVETAAEDISVGEYYLSTKNWKAALSRYQSALVLSPDEPNVYWGLAEAQRHLGDFAGAKKNYETLLAYDPDNKHAKEARKALKDPEIANAQAAKP